MDWARVTAMRWSSTTSTRPPYSWDRALAISQEPLRPELMGKWSTASWVSSSLSHREVISSGEGWDVLTSAPSFILRKNISGVQSFPSR